MKSGFLRFGILAVLFSGLLLFAAGSVSAQSEDLTIKLRRNFGYGLGSQIQGSFTLSAQGPSNLALVTFFIDGKPIGTDTSAPFEVKINTDNYTLGQHTFSAVGQTTGGQTIPSNRLTAEIVSPQSGMGGVLAIVGVILGIMVVVGVLQFVLTRRRVARAEPGAPRHYGASGGAICPKCGRPVELSPLSINWFTGKLQGCPYCGKWSVMKRASAQQLAAAEASERQAAQPLVPEETAEEKLRRQIEESRFG